MREDDLVQLLRQPARRVAAIRELVGGITATELRHIAPSPVAIQALIEGLRDRSPQVRWWCVQLLDHLPDGSAIDALVAVLDDPVPRVRRNAAHALGCLACKPTWPSTLPPVAIARLEEVAATDDNPKVRAEARRSLASRI
jgi:HEAT repeat protein